MSTTVRHPTQAAVVETVVAETVDEAERPRRVSLSARVTLLAAICVAGAVALVSLGAYLTVRHNLYQQAEQNLLGETVAAVQHSTVSGSGGNFTFPLPSGTYFNTIKFSVIDASGKAQPLMTSTHQPYTNSVPSYLIGPKQTNVAVQDNYASPDQLPSSAEEVDGYEVVAVAPPLQSGLAVVAAQPLTAESGVLDRLSVVLFLISGAGIVVAALAGTAIASGGLRPVARLTAAAERVAKTGDLRPIQVTGDDELARLTQSFNSMLGALAESQEQQRRLVADAGHELRTPLTSLRTNLELLVASNKPGAPRLSEQDTAELNADVSGQLDELTTLIGDLVELARQDAPQVVAEPVELVEVLERALDRARRRGSGIQFDVALQPWSLLGDSSALERAVMNLLDNAVKFSPPGGRVRVVLRPLGDGTAVLEVADSGPGISDEDLPHVFERFYRSADARPLPGSGLGLSIVWQAAQRHGGMAYAGHAPEGGALMTLRLPGRPA
ncbi:MAG TPA: HAMP domain-containing sensor histidine kinase [Pseudonocardiaceae bacterium]|jgi:two-component system sensor histidine kinase MprB|nr:HAMP domain-containing sensor histidine kinase [Pseudonocardiaceae bacterium]